MVPSGCFSPSARCRRSASHTPPVRIPISAVSALTCGRMRSASPLSRASASGILIEKSVQDEFRGERVHMAFAVAGSQAARARLALRFHRGQALVDQARFDPKAAAQPLSKLARQPGQPVLASVHRQRQPHHLQDRPPFLYQRGDAGKARIFGRGIDGLERVRDAELQFADSYSDATFAKVEGKYGAGRKVLKKSRVMSRSSLV